jgi:DNA uptake protein ComE-like DNA-binding protein
MARRSWLDPFARRLLIASGQIPPPTARAPQSGPASPAPAGAAASGPLSPEGERAEAVERELLALRLTQDPSLPLRDAEEVRRAAELGWWLDVNRATAADWRRLPGCLPEHIDLLVRLQQGGVQLSGAEDLAQLLPLDAATLHGWLPLLRFHWYDGPAEPVGLAPVAVNQASARELERLPQLTAERCARLLRERSRAPFRDLADLRDRLNLPPSVVEQWIGRVAFHPGPAGPHLPPARPPASPRRRP